MGSIGGAYGKYHAEFYCSRWTAKDMSPLNARIADQNLSCKQEKSKVMKNLFWNCSAPTADLQKRNPHSGQKMFVTKLERWPRTI